MAVLQLQDGGNSLGLVTNFIAMGKPASVTNSFSNSSALTIPESGPASTYPSPINVTGLSGNATRVTATLFGLSMLPRLIWRFCWSDRAVRQCY